MMVRMPLVGALTLTRFLYQRYICLKDAEQLGLFQL